VHGSLFLFLLEVLRVLPNILNHRSGDVETRKISIGLAWEAKGIMGLHLLDESLIQVEDADNVYGDVSPTDYV
jgi:hypothetical protein